MQRKGVPSIDGCLCEIKEKLKALYDRTHACILRINGKTPDGNGDITLDLSDAIPGRYVESVNGQDGNVIIDKASVGLSNVDNVSSSQILNQADANNQSRLEAFEAAKLDPVELEVTANSARIIQLEGQQVVLDDKMEQTIQYVDAIGDDVAEIKDAYVDKTTTQYITGKKYGPTPTSADYSGMWVNKDFVETTDPSRRQNNLVHTIGNESVEGRKNNAFSFNNFIEIDAFTTSRSGWHCLYDLGNVTRWISELVLARISNTNFASRASKSSFEICIETETNAFLKKNFVHGSTPAIKLCHDSNGWHIFVNCSAYTRTFTRLDSETYTWQPIDSTPKLSPNAANVVSEPSSSNYDIIVNVTEW